MIKNNNRIIVRKKSFNIDNNSAIILRCIYFFICKYIFSLLIEYSFDILIV